MKCPKCRYVSFEYLDECKKCGRDLTAHKKEFNIYIPRAASLDILPYLKLTKAGQPIVDQPMEDAVTAPQTDELRESGIASPDEIHLDTGEADTVEISSEGIKIDGDGEIDLNLDDSSVAEVSSSSDSDIELESFLDMENEGVSTDESETDMSDDLSSGGEIGDDLELTVDLGNESDNADETASSVPDIELESFLDIGNEGDSAEELKTDASEDLSSGIEIGDDLGLTIDLGDESANLEDDDKKSPSESESDDDILDFGDIDLGIDQ